jgi:glycerate 2-kinase
MMFDYLKTIRSVSLDFSQYSTSSNREIIVSVGKSGCFMYNSLIGQHPEVRNLHRLIIVPSATEADVELLPDIIFSSHPNITEQSFYACGKLFEFIKENRPEKITVLLSGGSSALIEKSADPEKTVRTNELLLKSGLNILEMNRIRSENSLIKNGKFAALFPKIIWQIFVMSDIPFKNGEKLVGSMPFFREDLKNTALFKCADSSTLHDQISSFFENVNSIKNFTGTVNELADIIKEFINKKTGNLVISGEPTLKIDHPSPGSGGRMSHLALKLLPLIEKSMKLYALSSDGIDGNSGFAGAVIENVSGNSFNITEIENSLANYDSAAFLNKYNMTLKSGYTGINLNDFVILLRS